MNTPDLDLPSCPLCESADRELIYNNFLPYTVVRCLSCKLFYLFPRPKESDMLKQYREDNYFQGEGMGYSNYAEQEDGLRATARHFLRNLKSRSLTGGNLLEIGCGYGYFLEEARSFFSLRVGTEFSPQSLAQARERADLVFEGGVDQVPDQYQFDSIATIQVIEHVYYPEPFLDSLLSRLKPGGKLIVATPNMGSFWRYLLGYRWPSFKIPEHILYFDKHSLFSLLTRLGIRNMGIIPYPHAFPLALVSEKLRLPIPDVLRKVRVWIPGTTIAVYGVKP